MPKPKRSKTSHSAGGSGTKRTAPKSDDPESSISAGADHSGGPDYDDRGESPEHMDDKLDRDTKPWKRLTTQRKCRNGNRKYGSSGCMTHSETCAELRYILPEEEREKLYEKRRKQFEAYANELKHKGQHNLYTEIGRCLKKVCEGVEEFDALWEEAMNPTNVKMKDKYDVELKKEVKKLQKFRDQIKIWSGEVNDPSTLYDARKLIETQMERHRLFEKESRVKTFSTSGLNTDHTHPEDPMSKIKRSSRNWLNGTIELFQIQLDQLETNVAEVLAEKKKTSDLETQIRIEKLKSQVKTHYFHIGKLETLLRILDNIPVSETEKLQTFSDQVKGIQDDVEYYAESGLEPDFISNDYLYDDIEELNNFSEVTVVSSNPLLSVSKQEVKSESGHQENSCEVTLKTDSTELKSPSPETSKQNVMDLSSSLAPLPLLVSGLDNKKECLEVKPIRLANGNDETHTQKSKQEDKALAVTVWFRRREQTSPAIKCTTKLDLVPFDTKLAIKDAIPKNDRIEPSGGIEVEHAEMESFTSNVDISLTSINDASPKDQNGNSLELSKTNKEDIAESILISSVDNAIPITITGGSEEFDDISSASESSEILIAPEVEEPQFNLENTDTTSSTSELSYDSVSETELKEVNVIIERDSVEFETPKEKETGEIIHSVPPLLMKTVPVSSIVPELRSAVEHNKFSPRKSQSNHPLPGKNLSVATYASILNEKAHDYFIQQERARRNEQFQDGTSRNKIPRNMSGSAFSSGFPPLLESSQEYLTLCKTIQFDLAYVKSAQSPNYQGAWNLLTMAEFHMPKDLVKRAGEKIKLHVHALDMIKLAEEYVSEVVDISQLKEASLRQTELVEKNYFCMKKEAEKIKNKLNLYHTDTIGLARMWIEDLKNAFPSGEVPVNDQQKSKISSVITGFIMEEQFKFDQNQAWLKIAEVSNQYSQCLNEFWYYLIWREYGLQCKLQVFNDEFANFENYIEQLYYTLSERTRARTQ